jgi:hypothetical protein
MLTAVYSVYQVFELFQQLKTWYGTLLKGLSFHIVSEEVRFWGELVTLYY